MGKRGPQPTPTQTLKLRGSWRAGEREGEPSPENGIPDPPAWLGEAGRELWDYYTRQLDGAGLMTHQDRDMLATFCQSVVDYTVALDVVRESGITIETASGNVVQHPAVGVKNKALTNMVKLGAMFGLSPSARVGLATGKQDKPTDKAAKFFGKGA